MNKPARIQLAEIPQDWLEKREKSQIKYRKNLIALNKTLAANGKTQLQPELIDDLVRIGPMFNSLIETRAQAPALVEIAQHYDRIGKAALELNNALKAKLAANHSDSTAHLPHYIWCYDENDESVAFEQHSGISAGLVGELEQLLTANKTIQKFLQSSGEEAAVRVSAANHKNKFVENICFYLERYGHKPAATSGGLLDSVAKALEIENRNKALKVGLEAWRTNRFK